MIKLKMKSYNIKLIEKQQKYLLYHQVNFINMNILLVKIYYHLIIEQTKFTYSPLRKAIHKQIKTIEDQGKKQVDALEKLKPKEIKLIEGTSNN